MNKKGISAVVTTVLIILLAIIAVIILWAAIGPMLKDTSKKAGETITCAQTTVDINSCVKNNTGILAVVSRSGGAESVTINATVCDSANRCKSFASITLNALDTKTMGIDDPNFSVNPIISVATRLPDGTLCTAITRTCTAA